MFVLYLRLGELHSRTNKLHDGVAYLKLLCCFLCPYREAALLIIVLSVISVVRMVYLVYEVLFFFQPCEALPQVNTK